MIWFVTIAEKKPTMKFKYLWYVSVLSLSQGKRNAQESHKLTLGGNKNQPVVCRVAANLL